MSRLRWLVCAHFVSRELDCGSCCYLFKARRVRRYAEASPKSASRNERGPAVDQLSTNKLATSTDRDRRVPSNQTLDRFYLMRNRRRRGDKDQQNTAGQMLSIRQAAPLRRCAGQTRHTRAPERPSSTVCFREVHVPFPM